MPTRSMAPTGRIPRRSRLPISFRRSRFTAASARTAGGSMTNLLELDAEGLSAFLAGLGEKPFRAKQVSHWIHQRLADDIAAMTDLFKSLRERLRGAAEIRGPAVISDTTA